QGGAGRGRHQHARGGLDRDAQAAALGTPLENGDEHLVPLAGRRATRDDARRPHEAVEVRVLSREREMVVPAAPDVIEGILVRAGCHVPLALEEASPATVDDGGEQPLLVAEVMVERRRRDACGLADLARRDFWIGRAREEVDRRLEDSGLRVHEREASPSYSASQQDSVASLWNADSHVGGPLDSRSRQRDLAGHTVSTRNGSIENRIIL